MGRPYKHIVSWYPILKFLIGLNNQLKILLFGMTFIHVSKVIRKLMILSIGLIESLKHQQNQYSTNY